MSAQVLQCPLCTKPFQVLPEHAGTVMQCPSCHQQVSIPQDLGKDQVEPPQETATEPESTTVVFACPVCEGQFSVLESMLGKQVGCPHCSATVVAHQPPAKSQPTATEEQEDPLDMFAPGYTAPGKPKRDPGETENKVAKTKTDADKYAKANAPSTDEKTEPVSQSPDDSKRRAVSPTAGPSKDASAPSSDAPVTQAPHSAVAGISQIVDDQPELAVDKVVWQPKDVSHLLPPRFDVDDPERLAFARRVENDSAVMLPDGLGGVRKIDNRMVTMQHDGESIQLVNLSPAAKKRKRLIQNVVTVVILMVILILAFLFLRKTV